MWDLAKNEVFLSTEKKNKYLKAIRVWHERAVHILADMQQLYRTLLHVTLVVPKGWVYLTSLEAMPCLTAGKPFLP
jgi:hypothetical protein